MQRLCACSGELLARGDRVAIAQQVITEFVHVVTDERRFQQPFSMETALNKSEHWWNAAEADQVLPTDVAIALFHTWMRRHQLGRKRVLDTLLAATYRAADVTSLLTLNATDLENRFVAVQPFTSRSHTETMYQK